jgi:predicted RNase H-like nuclease (RuvC/YqgF family)
MIIRFIKWLFGTKDKEEEEDNNTNDVQKEQRTKIHYLLKEVQKLKKIMNSLSKKNETDEQSARNLNTKLDILKERLDEIDTQTEVDSDEIRKELSRLQREHDEEVEKDKPKNPKKKKGYRDKLLDKNDK